MTRAGELSLLVAISLILGRLGPIDPAARDIAIALAMAAWLAAAVLQAPGGGTPRGLQPAGRWAGWIPALAAAAVLLRLDDPPARMAVVVLCTALACSPARRQACRFAGAALGFWLARDLLPGAWITEVELSRMISKAMGILSGHAMDWGPTASGLDLGVLALLLIASRPQGRPWSRTRRAAACVTAWACFLLVAPSVPAWRPAWLLGHGGILNRAGEHLELLPSGRTPALFWMSWLLLAVLAVVVCAGRRPAPSEEPSPVAAHPTAWKRHAAKRAAVAACALIGTGFVLACAWWPGAPRPHGRVVFVRSPLVDFEAPRPGRPGIGASGMFGLLGRYLALEGHALEVVDRPVTSGGLAGARIAIVPLPAAPLSEEETEALDRFARGGGSVLVLADHTDLLGTMRPINGLTARYGVQVRFDSAFPARHGWRGCVRARRPLPPAGDTGIGTGASLAIRPPARPLVIGDNALGDAGDRANIGPGAFLGDYAYQPGERLGDLVLAAETRVGKGRVVVMGDTSSLQNVALPWCWPFVAALFDHLTRVPSAAAEGAAAAGGLSGLMLIGAALRVRRPGAAVAGAACGVIAAVLVSAPHPAAARDEGTPRGAAAGPVALVDDGHLGAWSRELWTEASLGGLMANLQRAGFLPVASPRAVSDPPGPDSLVVLIAPRRTLTEIETQRLAAHVERGGRVLVAAGASQAAAVAPLLSIYGLSVRDLPLGPVPVRPDMTRAEYDAARAEPQFRDAYPIDSSGSVPVRALYRAFDRDVVVRAQARSGSGGALLVVGDPEFLTDRVLENERAAWPGNVDLLSRLLDDREGPR